MILLRIQEALRFWRVNFLVLLLICLPFAVLTTGAELLLGPMLVLDAGQQLTGVNLYSVVAILALRVWADATLIGQLGALQAGRARGLGECMLFGLSIFPALVLVELAVSVAMSLGLLLLILPGLWAFVRLSMSHFAVALERYRPMEALQASVRRTEPVQWIMLGSWSLLMLFGATITGLTGDLSRQLLGDHGGSLLLVNLAGLIMRTLTMVLLFRFYVLAREQETSAGDSP